MIAIHFSFYRRIVGTAILLALALPALRLSAQVLVIYADSSVSDVQTKLTGTGLFPGGITLYNAQSNAAPTLSTLQHYQAVLVYSNSTFLDPTSLGNVLADYVDSGGGVVQAVFTTFTSWSLAGRWETANYDPVILSTYGVGPVTLGTVYQPSSPIMAGVSSLNGGTSNYFASPLVLRSGATRIADWSNGTPLVVENSNFGNRVVALNLFPPSSDALEGSWLSSTQGALLMANAINFVSIPEPSTYALLALGAGLLSFAYRRRSR